VCPTCSGRGILLHEESATAGVPLPAAADASESADDED